MIENILDRLFMRRHFWRHASFSEVAELYASRTLRMTALYLVGGFLSIFLYKNGYGITSIALFWLTLNLFRVVISLPLAKLVSIIGPKRSTFISNISYIPAMVGFALLPTYGIWMLAPIIFFEAISISLYSIAYNVGFSKVKSPSNGGKELAFMHIMEKLACGLSPVVGGFLALWFGPEVVLVISGALFLAAAVPLFRTGEKVKLRKPLNVRALPWKLIRGHIVPHAIFSFQAYIIGTVWALYVAVVVIGVGTGDEVYAVVGVLSSVVLFVSLIAAIIYGRLVDNKKGKELMQFSIVFLSISHLFRGITSSVVGVATLNAGTEAANTGASIPYVRALFDNADRSGNRIAYFGITEMVNGLGSTFASALLLVLGLAMGEADALRSMFIIASGLTLLMLTARFPMYKK